MDEELIILETEDAFELEAEEVVESEVHAEDLEQTIQTEESAETVEVEVAQEIEVSVDEAVGWVGGDSTRHYSLYGRDEPNQHPISAITGLRAELDEIEKLQTVFSDKYNHANYYKWQITPEIPVGLFVSCPTADYIKVCNSTDEIFGVTVDTAAFIGGQDDIERGNDYGLVVCSGVVSVKCELDIVAGDSVVSNDHGYAKKTEGGYGYKVIGIKNIDRIPYAVIPLGISVNQVNKMMAELDIFDTRVKKVETDIVAAINVAQQAHNKASEVDSVSEEALKHALGAMFKAESSIDKNKELENIVTSANQIAVQAKAIAQSAVTEAESIRSEAEKTANDALAGVNDLIIDLEPITEWTYTDEAGEEHKGAEYLTTYIKNDVATKTEVHTVETLTEENKSSIDKSAESFKTLVSSVDKYSVGEYSQAYGLSREQAKSILKIGMIYVPTKHINSDSHSETFINETEPQWFTPGAYYEWGINDQGIHDWIEHVNSVAFGMNEPEYTEQLRYWYIDSDTADGGYEAHTLYIWKDDKWTKVNIYYNNSSNRIVNSISQDVNEISAEIVNARGSYSGLNMRLDNTDAQIQLATFWNNPDSGKSNLATMKMDANDEGSALALVVMGKNGEEKKLSGASIVLGQDNNESYISFDADRINFDASDFQIDANYINFDTDGFEIKANKIDFTSGDFTIDADKINFTTTADYSVIANNIDMTGYVTITELSGECSTTINGSNITTGSIASQNYVKSSGESGSKLDLTTGSFDSPYFKIDGDNNVTTIGPWTVTENAIYIARNSMSGTNLGVYIGADENGGIAIGTGTEFLFKASNNLGFVQCNYIKVPGSGDIEINNTSLAGIISKVLTLENKVATLEGYHNGGGGTTGGGGDSSGGDGCSHDGETYPVYVNNENGTHTIKTCCSKCDEVISEQDESCTYVIASLSKFDDSRHIITYEPCYSCGSTRNSTLEDHTYEGDTSTCQCGASLS